MLAHMNDIYSHKIGNMKKSVIRELLKLTEKPGMISFAGGLPSPLTFPREIISEVARDVVLQHGDWALQYGSTEGATPFKEEILKMMRADGETVEMDNILVTTASQQGLDMVGRVFIDPGDVVIMGRPTYIGAIAAFKGYEAEFVDVPLDKDGMIMDDLEATLQNLRAENRRVKFIYTVPDFQNPAGVTLSLERRQRMLQLAREYGVMIIEDTPYRELRYVGEHVPSILSMDNNEGHVVALHTFSKILFPGLRLGWITAHRDITDKFVIAKQAMDLCTPTMSQAIAYEYCRRGLLEQQLKETIVLYREKREAMLDALTRYMPEHPDISWTEPEGGLFLWVTLPESLNVEKLFYQAVEEKVAFVPGTAFHADGGGMNTFRLNFSYPSPDEIDEGIQRLAIAIEASLEG